MLYNKNNLVISALTSKDDTRPVLTGVLFQSEATIATDGYKMIMVETPKDDSVSDFNASDMPVPIDSSKSTNIPKDTVDSIARSLPRKPILPWLSNAYFTEKSDDICQIVTTDGVNHQKHTVKPIEGQYPDVMKVFPDGPAVATVNLNIKHLKEVIDCLSKMDLQDSKTVKIRVYADLKPVSFELKTKQGQRVQALLMPCKINE